MLLSCFDIKEASLFNMSMAYQVFLVSEYNFLCDSLSVSFVLLHTLLPGISCNFPFVARSTYTFGTNSCDLFLWLFFKYCIYIIDNTMCFSWYATPGQDAAKFPVIIFNGCTVPSVPMNNYRGCLAQIESLMLFKQELWWSI